MFAKKRTPMYQSVASDMKALHGRHARLDSGLRANYLVGAPSSACVVPQQSQNLATASELESKFQEFFRMGAVVAIGELFDEGMLGDKAAVAQDVRAYLVSFGVASLADVQALGVSGPYLQDFECIFGASASFPPAA